MSPPTVRVYNVLFGDAASLRAPVLDSDSGYEQIRHILIDVGNILGDRKPRGDAALHERASKN